MLFCSFSTLACDFACAEVFDIPTIYLSNIYFMKRFILISFCLSLACFVMAQGGFAEEETLPGNPSETNVRGAKYPRILSDNSAVFRIKAPEAQKVQVRIGRDYDMTRDAEGVWTATTAPLRSGFHAYSFVIDGVAFNDPGTDTFFTTGRWISAIEVPEANVDFYHIKEVPHGDVRRARYLSAESGQWRQLFIYTPPAYDTDPNKKYPVLYIQHGAGENESSWSTAGKLDIIMDNLIADGKAVPMIVVMSDDYLVPDIGKGYNTPSTNAFFDMFARDLLHSIIPFVEKHYRAIPDRRHRALAGLSMGGGITFRVGLNNLDSFANVGVFSTSALRGKGEDIFDIEAQVPGLLSKPAHFNKQLDLFYISNGEQDGSYKYTIKTVETLRAHGVEVELKTFPGVHEWQVWRKALHDFAPRLFR